MRSSSWPGSRIPRIFVQSSTARSRSCTSRQTWANGPLGMALISPWYGRTSGWRRGSEAERAAHDLLHDLGGPAVDPLDAGVAPHAGDLVFLHVAVAAVQLQAQVDHLELQLGRPVL